MIVDHHRRDRRDEAERGRQQRLGNAGRDHGEIGRVRLGDADEGIHDAPHRAEQADERRGGADGREHAGAARDLLRHRRLHPLQPQGDALFQTVIDDAAGQAGLRAADWMICATASPAPWLACSTSASVVSLSSRPRRRRASET